MLSQCGVRGFHGNDITSNLARVPGAKQLGGIQAIARAVPDDVKNNIRFAEAGG